MTTPVRWKLPVAALLLLYMAIAVANSAKIESMASLDDGWRPIVGAQRDGPYDEITHYRNPASKKADPVKAEKLTAHASKMETGKKLAPASNVQNVPSNLNQVPKMPPHNKPVYLLPTIGKHTPQLGPMSAIHHHRPMKYSHLMKVHHHAKPPRMKPLRHQIPSYSQRDEVFVPAPSSNVGPYTFYSATQPQLKHRLPQHIEFANHFPIPNTDDELYQLVRAPVHQYVIPKAPNANDVHYTFQNQEDYNRNLPPSPYKFESNKETVKKAKDVPRQEALVQNFHHFHVSTPQPSKQVEVHVTKEKLKVFHNAIPSNYNPSDDYDYRPVKSTVAQKRPATYEVTEGKWSQETPVFQYRYTTPPKTRVPTRVFTEESKPFLPTPIKPDNVPPTLPTDSEIATIYNQVKYNRQNAQPSRSEFSTPTPINFFDVKEVSTHFPILGPPEFQTIAYSPPPRYQYSDEQENEITTKQQNIERPIEQQQGLQEVIETTTQYIPTVRPQRNRRPNRRRRPSSTTTTEIEEVAEMGSATEVYEAQKTDSSAEVTTQRLRIPSRYRVRSTSTPQPEVETTTIRQRQRRPRPTTTTEEPEIEVPGNHKAEYESLEEKFARLTTTTERDFPANFESHFTAPYKSEAPTEIYEKSTEEIPHRPNRLYTNPPNRDEKPVEEEAKEEEEEPASVESTSDEKEEEKILEDYRIQYHESQKQPEALSPEITINTPENELDFTTRQTHFTYYTTKPPREETTTELYTTTTTTTTPAPTPTTTTSTTTEAPKRVRGRPVKYDQSNRPRFSVKEYKQRLTTTTTSSEAPKVSQSDVMRIRFPNRSRRPITPSPTTTPAPGDDENEPKSNNKFQPKDPRHPNLENATEKLKFNTANTRIRPFGRFKTTTESSSTTLRVSIKPNIFGNLRRPTPISLKTRILNRQRTNATTIKPDVTTLDNNLDDSDETDQTEIVETTIPYSVEESDATLPVSQFGAKTTEAEATTAISTQLDDVQKPKHDDFIQSQIVSDLTSSAKNEYHKPGLFKNVQPNSRKVPSYFTLATDDPILPIEAFFPNLKDKQ